MTTRWPSRCSRAASSIALLHNNGTLLQRQLLLVYRQNNTTSLILPSTIRCISSSPRRYDSKAAQNKDSPPPEQAALLAIQNPQHAHPINPPSSTRPPPLKLPDIGDLSTPVYYFRIGRAYGSFYWRGVKAVWYNHQAAKLLKTRLEQSSQSQPGEPSNHLSELTRAQHQLLARNAHDISKLPFFGLLVCLFGEWLPLIVPFIPGAVPGTCRIPKQVRGMREKSEARRLVAFRKGVREPQKEQVMDGKGGKKAGGEWATTQRAYCGDLLGRFNGEQLFHLSSSLGIHNRLWDRLSIPPPSVLMKRGLAKKLAEVSGDDYLLIRYGESKAVREMLPVEVELACEQRAIDVLGKREGVLRGELEDWLKRRKKVGGDAGALMVMLFRRPNAWDTKVKR